MTWLHSDVTGWGAFGSVVILFLISLLTERIVLRRFMDRLLQSERTRGDFFEEALEAERERNNILVGGLVEIVKEIRAAVQDPRRPL